MALPKISKPNAAINTKPAEAAWKGDDFKDQFPHVSAFWEQATYDDGSPRQSGTIIIFVQDGMLKACVSDRDNGRSAFVTAPTFQALWELIEHGLAEAKLEWRGIKR